MRTYFIHEKFWLDFHDFIQLSGSKQKLLVPFEGGTHNETYLCPGYYEAIAQFVHKVSYLTLSCTV